MSLFPQWKKSKLLSVNNIYTTASYTEFTHLDAFYEEILGIIPSGRFIEIGAFDGQTNSKTAHLADIGWEGIYVEPIKEYRDQCISRHSSNKVTVLPFAISDKNENVTMYKGGLPSTLKASQQEHISSFTKKNASELEFTNEEVISITWDYFVNHHVTHVPDILVVDAEGFDFEIINSIDFENFRPTIICCEIFPETTPFIHPTSIQEGKKIIEKLVDVGYYIWLQEEHNILFSTKPIPKKQDDINKGYSHLFNLANDKELKPKSMSFLRQLLKTILQNDNVKNYSFLVDLFAKHVDGTFMADSNLLAFLLMSLNKKKEADNLLKWSEHSSQVYDVSNTILQILNSSSFDLDISNRMHQLIEYAPYELLYVALRKLQMKA